MPTPPSTSGNEEQASLEVAAHGGDNEGGKDEDEPTQNPEGAAGEDDGQDNADGAAVTHEEQGGTDGSEDWRGVAQQLDEPADPAPFGTQGQEGDEEFEIEVDGDDHQLQNDGRVPEAVEPGRAAGQLKEGDGRLQQFVQGEPEILDMALLREVEDEQKDGQDQEQDGNNQARAGVRRGCRPTTTARDRSRSSRLPRRRCAILEKACVGVIAEGDVGCSRDQGQRGFRRRNVEVVDAGDGLIVLRQIAVGALRVDQFSICKDIRAGSGGDDAEGGGLGDGQFDQEGDRAVIGREFDMEAEPGKAPLANVRDERFLVSWLEPFAD